MTTLDQRPPGRHAPARFYRMHRRRRRWLGPVLWALFAVAAIGGAIGSSALLFVDEAIDAASPDTPEFRAAVAATDPVLPGEPTNILLIGSDKRPGRDGSGDNGRSDSLILVKMDPDQDFISMLSFPRDLVVEIPGYGVDKINAAFSLGGPKLVVETVKKLTGEPVNDFVNIDFQGFVRIVNAVGGVYIDVDRRYFNDNSGPGPSYEAIDLQPGYQRLDGDDALDFARYRHTDSDRQRINRQQQFLSEVKRQTKRLSNLLQLPSFAKIFRENIQMSIDDRGELLGIIQLALTVDKARIARTRIEGVDSFRGEISTVETTPGEVAEAVERWKNPEFLESTVRRRKVVPADVRVDVLNGNGRVLAAEAGARVLAQKGYRALSAGNAASFDNDSSEVVYAPGKREEGRAVQRLFGPFTGLTASPTRLPGGADVQVVLGLNFDGSLVPPPPPPAPVKAEVVGTTSLVNVVRSAQRAVGDLKLVVPTRVPPGSELRRVRLYRINTPGTGPWAMKMVFRVPGGGGINKYWSFTQTEWTDNIPILEGETGVLKADGRQYKTYYDGRSKMREGWKENGMSYWVSNTLDNDLNAETMHAIARSAKPLPRAKLPVGTQDVAIPVEIEASTP